MALNQIILCGRLTADPEQKTSQSGVESCRFQVAIDRDYSKSAEKTTDFIQCVAFSKLAEFVGKWFKKGTPIIVTGRLETNSYTDKDGNKRVQYIVNAKSIEFVPKTKNDEDVPNYTEIPNDDLPFTV